MAAAAMEVDPGAFHKPKLPTFTCLRRTIAGWMPSAATSAAEAAPAAGAPALLADAGPPSSSCITAAFTTSSRFSTLIAKPCDDACRTASAAAADTAGAACLANAAASKPEAADATCGLDGLANTTMKRPFTAFDKSSEFATHPWMLVANSSSSTASPAVSFIAQLPCRTLAAARSPQALQGSRHVCQLLQLAIGGHDATSVGMRDSSHCWLQEGLVIQQSTPTNT
jgi:hypothetical protein